MNVPATPLPSRSVVPAVWSRYTDLIVARGEASWLVTIDGSRYTDRGGHRVAFVISGWPRRARSLVLAVEAASVDGPAVHDGATSDHDELVREIDDRADMVRNDGEDRPERRPRKIAR